MKALLAALALVLLPYAAWSAPTPEQATQRGYVFTMDLLQRYCTATRALNAAAAKDPSLKAEMEQTTDDPVVGIARLKTHPRIFAFFKAQGFTERDAVLLGAAIIEASFASAEPDLHNFPNVSPQQVNFLNAHDAQVRAIFKGVFLGN